jgi:hypothetical protein
VRKQNKTSDARFPRNLTLVFTHYLSERSGNEFSLGAVAAYSAEAGCEGWIGKGGKMRVH